MYAGKLENGQFVYGEIVNQVSSKSIRHAVVTNCEYYEDSIETKLKIEWIEYIEKKGFFGVSKEAVRENVTSKMLLEVINNGKQVKDVITGEVFEAHSNFCGKTVALRPVVYIQGIINRNSVAEEMQKLKSPKLLEGYKNAMREFIVDINDEYQRKIKEDEEVETVIEDFCKRFGK